MLVLPIPATKVSVQQPQTKSPAPGDSKGIGQGEIITLDSLFGNEFDLSLTFMKGTPDQGALSQLVSIADQKAFKRQVDYYDLGGKNLPYWSNNHRLVDTAYVHVRYELSEEMTEIPELEYLE